MCGFVGYVEDGEKDRKIIKSMSDTIKHRGPDDEGFYEDDKISLAFRRLSIIDLSNGHQPMFNEDSSMVILFNGEIYNYQELKEDLMAKGHVLPIILIQKLFFMDMKNMDKKLLKNLEECLPL